MAVNLAPGVVLSHFRLERELGRGGMGVVFEATDLRLGRRVALKVVRPDAAGVADAMNELEREARLAAAVSHPNLVTVFTFERAGTDALIAMELLQGYSLADRLKTGWQASVPEAARLLSEIAAGVSAAHAAGILHLDLKPGNIMILPDGRVKVLDFGIARMARQADDARGALRGTPAYMAPEQLRGEPVAPATDVWAIGVIGVHLITGVRPYEGTDPGIIARAVLQGPPSAIMHPAAPAIFGGLTEVLRSCLQPLRSRLPDAGALLAAIGKHGLTSAVAVPPGGVGISSGYAPVTDPVSGAVSAPVTVAVPRRRLVQLAVGAAFALLIVAGAAVKYRTQPLSTTLRQSGSGGGSVPSLANAASSRPLIPPAAVQVAPRAPAPAAERAASADSVPQNHAQLPAQPVVHRMNANTSTADSARKRRAVADSAARALYDFVATEVNLNHFAEAAAAVFRSAIEPGARNALLTDIRNKCNTANTLRSVPKACP